MKFKSIEKKSGGAFLHRYNITYELADGSPKVYEMVSRSPDLDSYEKIVHNKADAVVMVITDKSNEHMLMLREFRMELGRQIFGLPGGLIEEGETPEQTAARELKEETGLTLTGIYEVFPPSPCTVGIANEMTICIFGCAEGEIRPNTEQSEEIRPAWYSREEVLRLHKSAEFGSWCMAYSRLWAGGFPGNKR